MPQKQTILGRISTMLRANINAMLDRAEDPEQMLDQMIRDFTSEVQEAEQAIAQTIGNLRLAEQDYRADVAEAADWGKKAQAASSKADQLRASGSAAEADRFDGLAKVALTRQIQSESEVRAQEPQLAAQQEVVAKLKSGLEGMKQKLVELRGKRDELVARQKSAAAREQVQRSISTVDITDPTSELSRFEERIRAQEARVTGMEELQSSSFASQFDELEDLGQMSEVEARLAQLKAGTAGQLGTGQGTGQAAPKQLEDLQYDEAVIEEHEGRTADGSSGDARA